jgi:hypothetical protein
MKFFNSLKSIFLNIRLFIIKNLNATMNLIGILSYTDYASNDIITNVRKMNINDEYRTKGNKQSSPRRKKLTYERVWHNGMNVTAYVYNKSTDEFGKKLTTTSSIKDMAKIYKIDPSTVSQCAVYNALYETRGENYADRHIRIIKKYVTPGSVESLSTEDKMLIATNMNTITFKYEY